jgi:hypothetical protein
LEQCVAITINLKYMGLAWCQSIDRGVIATPKNGPRIQRKWILDMEYRRARQKLLAEALRSTIENFACICILLIIETSPVEQLRRLRANLNKGGRSMTKYFNNDTDPRPLTRMG